MLKNLLGTIMILEICHNSHYETVFWEYNISFTRYVEFLISWNNGIFPPKWRMQTRAQGHLFCTCRVKDGNTVLLLRIFDSLVSNDHHHEARHIRIHRFTGKRFFAGFRRIFRGGKSFNSIGESWSPLLVNLTHFNINNMAEPQMTKSSWEEESYVITSQNVGQVSWKTDNVRLA